MEPMSELGIELFSAQLSLGLIEQVTRGAHSNAVDLQKFTDQVLAKHEASSPEDLLRVGIGLHVIGRFSAAVEKLQGAKDCLEKYMVLGFAQRACGQYEDALASFHKTLDFKADALVVATERVATSIKATERWLRWPKCTTSGENSRTTRRNAASTAQGTLVAPSNRD